MRQIAISYGRMNSSWQKYPKIEKSIRILQPKALGNNTCPTNPGIGCGTLVCICRGEIPLRFLKRPIVLKPKSVGPAHDNAILLLHSSFSILHSFEVDFISTFFI
jgi:hypothetical protein